MSTLATVIPAAKPLVIAPRVMGIVAAHSSPALDRTTASIADFTRAYSALRPAKRPRRRSPDHHCRVELFIREDLPVDHQVLSQHRYGCHAAERRDRCLHEEKVQQE